MLNTIRTTWKLIIGYAGFCFLYLYLWILRPANYLMVFWFAATMVTAQKFRELNAIEKEKHNVAIALHDLVN